MHKKIAILCFGAFILAVASVIFVQRGYFEKQSYLSGDEPHYIMLADNLTHYGDFDIKRTFQDHRWSLYYTGTVLEPHVSPVFNKDSSHWYSIHTVGLPLLLAAPYAVGGVIGARIFIMLVQLSLIPLFYLLLRRFIASPKRRMLALGLLAFNPLYWQNVGAIMPDMVVVVLAVLALLLFWRKDIWSNIALIMIVVLAYLVHTKGLLLVGPIVLAKYAADIATVGLKKWIRKGWIYLVIAGVAVISYSLFLLALYGSFSPTKLYGSNGQLFMANPFFNLVATLVDRDKGLLLFSPILLIVPLYLYRSFSGARDFCVDIVGRLKKHRAPTTSQFAALGVAIGLLSLLATQLGFADWSGSTSPNGRYYLVFVLFAIFLIAKYINLKNWLELTIVGVVVIFYLFMWKASIISFKNYMTPGVNSFIVDKYPILGHLPVFKIVVQGDSALPSVWQGVRLLGDILVGNILWGWAIVLAGQHRFLARHK